jgi:hypothetical protein
MKRAMALLLKYDSNGKKPYEIFEDFVEQIMCNMAISINKSDISWVCTDFYKQYEPNAEYPFPTEYVYKIAFKQLDTAMKDIRDGYLEAKSYKLLKNNKIRLNMTETGTPFQSIDVKIKASYCYELCEVTVLGNIQNLKKFIRGIKKIEAIYCGL